MDYVNGEILKDNNNGGFYMGPMVYFGTYPMPLPLWQQMMERQFPPSVNMPGMQSDMTNYFALPFPEDQE